MRNTGSALALVDTKNSRVKLLILHWSVFYYFCLAQHRDSDLAAALTINISMISIADVTYLHIDCTLVIAAILKDWLIFFLQKKVDISKLVSSPHQSKLEIIQPCKAPHSSVGLKSLLKVNTSIGNRTQSRKTLQSILQANKSIQGSSQNNFNKSYPLNGLQKKESGEGSSQNAQIPLESRNIQGGIFSVCVESSKGSPNIKIVQPGVQEVSLVYTLKTC